jgi:DNA-binding NarL/FixJ family response regulator
MASAGSAPTYDEDVMVGAVDDHPTIVSGLRAELHRIDPRQHFVGSAPTVAGLLDGGPHLDVVLLDVLLGDGSQPRDNIRRLRAAGAQVLIFADRGSDALMREAIAAGALGIVLKDEAVTSVAEAVQIVNGGRFAVSPELAAILRSSDQSRPKLSERERQVLELYAVGLPAKSVARRLGVQIGTAKVYLKRIRAKYAALDRGAGTRVELYQRAIEDGFVDPPGRGWHAPQ